MKQKRKAGIRGKVRHATKRGTGRRPSGPSPASRRELGLHARALFHVLKRVASVPGTSARGAGRDLTPLEQLTSGALAVSAVPLEGVPGVRLRRLDTEPAVLFAEALTFRYDLLHDQIAFEHTDGAAPIFFPLCPLRGMHQLGHELF
jgi:hypothetical protein